MSRAPFQVLVIPFRRRADGVVEFAALQRRDDGSWQGVAGGGEGDETPVQAAIRELQEELDLVAPRLFELESRGAIPVKVFAASKDWPESLTEIPEYAFAVDCTRRAITLSDEHTSIVWGQCAAIRQRLKWGSNRGALVEAHRRIARDQLRPPPAF